MMQIYSRIPTRIMHFITMMMCVSFSLLCYEDDDMLAGVEFGGGVAPVAERSLIIVPKRTARGPLPPGPSITIFDLV